MARIRTIKPEFWTDEDVVECSFAARLLFVGMWNFADDAGRIRFSAKRIRMQIFPSDDVDVAALVQELLDHTLVEIYEAEGITILSIPHFLRHQKIDNPSRSRLPANPRAISTSPRESSRSPRDPSPKPRESSEFNPAEREREKEKEGIKEGIKEREGKAPPVLPLQGSGIAPAVPEDDDVFPEDLSVHQCASALLEKLVLPSSQALVSVVVTSIQALAKDSGSTIAATATEILARSKRHRAEGVAIGRWWFEDGTFARNELPAKRRRSGEAPRGDPSTSWTPEAVEARAKAEDENERESYRMYLGMSEKYKAANPWTGRKFEAQQ